MTGVQTCALPISRSSIGAAGLTLSGDKNAVSVTSDDATKRAWQFSDVMLDNSIRIMLMAMFW